MAADNTVTPIGNLTDDPEFRSERVSPSIHNTGGSHEWNR
jgi:hypothetical protein